MTFGRLAIIFASTASVAVLAQAPTQPDWKALEDETMRHYQAVLRLDTRNPPGNEHVVAEYVKGVLEKEGIPAQIVGSDPNRPNLMARLKGNGRKRPLLIIGHSDTVTTDEAKWTPPAAERDARRRLRLRPRHHRRQGQPDRVADDDAAAEAAERAARPRRDLPVRGRRRRRSSGRHRLPGEGALSRRSTRSIASPKAAA